MGLGRGEGCAVGEASDRPFGTAGLSAGFMLALVVWKRKGPKLRAFLSPPPAQVRLWL